MKTRRHYLKTWPQYFAAIQIGGKTYEVRKNDRAFQQGDKVTLQEFDPLGNNYTGRQIEAEIGFVICGPGFGIKKGYCVFSLLNIEDMGTKDL